MTIRLKIEIILIAIIFCYLAATYQRNTLWVDEFTLWKDSALKSPLKARSHISLGVEYKDKGDTQNALKELKRALELNPSDARIYNNFGTVYSEMDLHHQAFKSFKKAIELKPNYSPAHNNLGTVYLHYKKYQEAIECFKKALTFNPYYVDAYSNLGYSYYLLGKNDKS